MYLCNLKYLDQIKFRWAEDLNFICVQLDQTKHAFPFGSAITAPRLYKTNDPLNEAYRDYFFDNFNWATLANAMKWRYMESNEVSNKCCNEPSITCSL